MNEQDKRAFMAWYLDFGFAGDSSQQEEVWQAALEYARGQPVQPAGAQDPVHFRAVLCSEQQNRAVGVVPKVVGFVDRKAAEQFILEKRDFQGWKYNLESLYTTPPSQPVQPAVNEQLLEALKNVMPWVVSQEVACNGLKCRELVCSSCFSDSNESAEKAAQSANKAYETIAAAEAAKGGV